MAKARQKPTSAAGYFKQLFQANPDWLGEGFNQQVIERWKQDHPGEDVTRSVLNGLANTRSLMRKKLGLGKSRRRKRRKGAAAAVPPAANPEAAYEANFPEVGTPRWGEMNRLRAELIRKKVRGKLSDSEQRLYEALQRGSREALDKAFPRGAEQPAARRVRAPYTVLERMEGLIDDCLRLARQQNSEGLDSVVKHLRVARRQVAWEMGEPKVTAGGA
jgi:hypothetical protein